MKRCVISLTVLFVFMLTALTGCQTPVGPSLSFTQPDTDILITEPSATEPSSTEPPTTNPPATVPAENETPTTDPPTTEPSVTDPSNAIPPVTETPVTEPSVTEPPVTEPPATEPPATEPPHVHAYTAKVKSPTCTEGGYTTYTCSCGNSYRSDETPATGHQYTETVVPPRVGKAGYTEHLCACGKLYWDNYTSFSEEEMAQIEAELASLIMQELNRVRAAQGAGVLENQTGMSQVAQYRSRQLRTHYGHHTLDIRAAHAEYQYGRYVDMTEYGFPESYNYYSSNSAEAIGWIGIIDDLQEQAEHVVNAFFLSEAHWSYLGDDKNTYCGIGCSVADGHWMICIMVNDITYG